jgi:type I restriction enzyme M protein
MMGNSQLHVTDEVRRAILERTTRLFPDKFDSGAFKDYILSMVFLKHISDIWAHRLKAAKRRFGSDSDGLARQMANERFVIPESGGFAELYARRSQYELGLRFNEIFHALERANSQRLGGVFSHVDFNSEARLGERAEINERWRRLLEELADPRLDLRPSNHEDGASIAGCFRMMIDRFATQSAKKAPDFTTPPNLARLLAMLVDPQPGERICDPVCGAGELLLACAAEAGKAGGEVYLFGQEIDRAAWAIGKMNMAIHGVEHARLELGDVLREPLYVDKGKLTPFDVVVGDLPFVFDGWRPERATRDPYQRFRRGVPPQSRAEYAFISHVVACLAPNGGRAVVTAPHGVLFRELTEGKMRRRMIDEHLIETVIGMPPNLLYGPGIPFVILILRRDRVEDDILFVDASTRYITDRTRNRLREDDIRRIVRAVRLRQNEPHFARVVGSKEIQVSEYNLNVSRYVDTFPGEQESAEALEQQIAEIETSLVETRARIGQIAGELGQ